MKTATFFESREELRRLTGCLDDNQLWDVGFNLDDWDFGFVSDEPWNDNWGDYGNYYEYWLLDRMKNHCVGYEEVEYNGKYYYMLYHS